MTHIVDSLRKHQKIIVLGVALGVIALYIVPVDQIVAAIPPQGQAGIDRAISHIQDTRDRIAANTHIPPDVQTQIDQHLYEVQQHLGSL